MPLPSHFCSSEPSSQSILPSQIKFQLAHVLLHFIKPTSHFTVEKFNPNFHRSQHKFCSKKETYENHVKSKIYKILQTTNKKFYLGILQATKKSKTILWIFIDNTRIPLEITFFQNLPQLCSSLPSAQSLWPLQCIFAKIHSPVVQLRFFCIYFKPTNMQ